MKMPFLVFGNSSAAAARLVPCGVSPRKPVRLRTGRQPGDPARAVHRLSCLEGVPFPVALHELAGAPGRDGRPQRAARAGGAPYTGMPVS